MQHLFKHFEDREGRMINQPSPLDAARMFVVAIESLNFAAQRDINQFKFIKSGPAFINS